MSVNVVGLKVLDVEGLFFEAFDCALDAYNAKEDGVGIYKEDLLWCANTTDAEIKTLVLVLNLFCLYYLIFDSPITKKSAYFEKVFFDEVLKRAPSHIKSANSKRDIEVAKENLAGVRRFLAREKRKDTKN